MLFVICDSDNNRTVCLLGIHCYLSCSDIASNKRVPTIITITNVFAHNATTPSCCMCDCANLNDFISIAIFLMMFVDIYIYSLYSRNLIKF